MKENFDHKPQPIEHITCPLSTEKIGIRRSNEGNIIWSDCGNIVYDQGLRCKTTGAIGREYPSCLIAKADFKSE